MRRFAALLVAFASGCVSLTPAGARVAVYQAPLDAAPANRSMPAGCRLIAAQPPMEMTELDLVGQKDPFRKQRNEAGAASANALLILRRMTISRQNSECPAASPITDCPPSFGAWYRVAVESYACTPEAIAMIATLPKPTPAPNPTGLTFIKPGS